MNEYNFKIFKSHYIELYILYFSYHQFQKKKQSFFGIFHFQEDVEDYIFAKEENLNYNLIQYCKTSNIQQKQSHYYMNLFIIHFFHKFVIFLLFSCNKDNYCVSLEKKKKKTKSQHDFFQNACDRSITLKIYIILNKTCFYHFLKIVDISKSPWDSTSIMGYYDHFTSKSCIKCIVN